MRTRAFRPVTLAGLVAGAFALPLVSACALAHREAAPPTNARTSANGSGSLDVTVTEPEPVVMTPAAGPTRARAEDEERDDDDRTTAGDAGTSDLPPTWSTSDITALPFDDAIRRARAARDAYERLTPPSSNDEPAMKAWFSQAEPLVDRASRMFAAAFHASDGSREGRIDAIAEAAELDFALARRLDDLGLVAMPKTWRADPSVRATFEDVAFGPFRRWRDEARVLSRSCLETARETAVATAAVRRCAAVRAGTGGARLARAAAPDGGACACSPGDPLCSASLGGWCRSR